ncbi:hypothetical protein AVEN_73040-1 [Araneus ventricosus]|uniref:Retrovirus-related Pol polyprotein from transposon TNT 1-94-like beta-barrel domain-containing protein n=1 Tax=Araneus ventricosus TaxID=182803 RepID=A0A4Y2TDJ7_ARAVE|nr:hypothetical protein AVEN_73040-1 [Araneus ventricosus]
MAEVINSEKVEVTRVGDIVFSLHEDDEGPRNIKISNVLYMPKLGRNLLSIGRIEEKCFKVEFLNGEAKVIGKNGATVLTAKRKGRLYIIKEIFSLSPSNASLRTKQPVKKPLPKTK